MTLYHQLSTIKQDKFSLLDDYIQRIDRTVQRLGIAKNLSASAIQLKREETFFNGLSDRVRLELTRLNVKSFSEAVQLISTTEIVILEQLRTSIEQGQSTYSNYNRQSQYTSRNSTSNNHDKRQNSSRNNNRNPGNDSKYCDHHKFFGHSTEECNALKNEKNQTSSFYNNNSNKNSNSKYKNNNNNNNYNKNSYKQGDNHKSMALREPTNPSTTLSISCIFQSATTPALVDTCATTSHMKTSFAKQIGAILVNIDATTVEAANGEAMIVKETTQTAFNIENDTMITYNHKFNVADNLTVDVILGMDFLLSNDAIINFKSNTLSIDAKKYEITSIGNAKFHPLDAKLDEKTKICTILSPQEQITNMVKRYIYNNPILGEIANEEHIIELHNPAPCSSRGYQVPLAKVDETNQEMEKLIRLGVIQETTSPFCSPAFPIYKKNGNVRIVVDFRKLNSQTVPSAYPIPKIFEYLQQLKGSKIYSTLDLNSCYYQIRIREEDRKFTGFTLLNRSFTFNRMPFGLCNSPRTFQAAMMRLFKDKKCVNVYLDDILVHSKEGEDHIAHLKTVLGTLHENGASINFEKSTFGKSQVTYLGNTISEEGIRPDINLTDKLENVKPISKRDGQKVLGLIQWFRPYLKDCSYNTLFLTAKLKDNAKNKWIQEDAKQLSEIIQQINARTLFNYPDFNKQFELYYDASQYALGAVLKQCDNLIGYYS